MANYTIVELRQLCKDNDLKGCTTLNKAQLRNRLVGVGLIEGDRRQGTRARSRSPSKGRKTTAYTVVQLRQMCKSNGIRGCTTMKKQRMVTLLKKEGVLKGGGRGPGRPRKASTSPKRKPTSARSRSPVKKRGPGRPRKARSTSPKRKPCGPGKVRNPDSKRCVKVGRAYARKVGVAGCGPEKVYNPKSKRCISVRGAAAKKAGLARCPQGKVVSPKGRCIAIGGATYKKLVKEGKLSPARSRSRSRSSSRSDSSSSSSRSRSSSRSPARVPARSVPLASRTRTRLSSRSPTRGRSPTRRTR